MGDGLKRAVRAARATRKRRTLRTDPGAIRKALIDAGVRNLREFGYESASADNILTATIFRAFFKEMLTTGVPDDPAIRGVADELLKEIAE